MSRYDSIEALNACNFQSPVSGGLRGQHRQTMERVMNKIPMKVLMNNTSPHRYADLVFCF